MNTSIARPEPRAFLPSDLNLSRAICRCAAAIFLAEVKRERVRPEEIVARSWPRDPAARALIPHVRAAVAPTTTAATSLVPTNVSLEFITSLAPASGAAELARRGIQIDLAGVGSVLIPHIVTHAPVSFVGEGAPIPVIAHLFADATLGPTKKMAAISVLTGELQSATADAAATIIETALRESTAAALDGAVFSAVAADTVRPAGILVGAIVVSPTVGGQAIAAAADIRGLIAALVANGGGASPLLAMAPGRAAALTSWLPGLRLPVVSSLAIAPDSVIALDETAFVIGTDLAPLIDITKSATVHEDTAPAAISTPGSPNTVSAPLRSFFQTDDLGLRLRLPVTWTTRGPVSVVNNVTW